MKPKQLQAKFIKKQRSHSAVTQPKVMKTVEKGPKELASDQFRGYIEYLLNLSASGKRSNKDWTWLKNRLTEAGHWKKAYIK